MSALPVTEAPVHAQLGPCIVEVEKGKTYLWCSCGRSKTQPYCDNAHKGTAFLPVRYDARETRTIFFCGCKESRIPPLCDSTHTLVSGYLDGKR